MFSKVSLFFLVLSMFHLFFTNTVFSVSFLLLILFRFVPCRSFPSCGLLKSIITKFSLSLQCFRSLFCFLSFRFVFMLLFICFFFAFSFYFSFFFSLSMFFCFFYKFVVLYLSLSVQMSFFCFRVLLFFFVPRSGIPPILAGTNNRVSTTQKVQFTHTSVSSLSSPFTLFRFCLLFSLFSLFCVPTFCLMFILCV